MDLNNSPVNPNNINVNGNLRETRIVDPRLHARDPRRGEHAVFYLSETTRAHYLNMMAERFYDTTPYLDYPVFQTEDVKALPWNVPAVGVCRHCWRTGPIGNYCCHSGDSRDGNRYGTVYVTNSRELFHDEEDTSRIRMVCPIWASECMGGDHEVTGVRWNHLFQLSHIQVTFVHVDRMLFEGYRSGVLERRHIFNLQKHFGFKLGTIGPEFDLQAELRNFERLEPSVPDSANGVEHAKRASVRSVLGVACPSVFYQFKDEPDVMDEEEGEH